MIGQEEPHSDLPNRHALAACATTIGLAIVVFVALTMRDTYWGDPTIYFVYARNAAHGYPFAFNPGGGFSSGVASPLWSLVLAVPFLLGGGPEMAKATSVLFAAVGYLVSWLRRAGSLGLGSPALQLHS